SGRYLASGGEQPSEVKVWDLTRHQEYITAARVGGRIEAVGFSADGESVHVARATGWLQTAGAMTGVEREQKELDLSGQWRTPAILAAFSGDGRRLAAVSREDTRVIAITDVAIGQVIHRLESPYEVLHLAFSQDGRRVAASSTEWRGGGRHEVGVWAAETGERLAAIPCEHYSPTGTYSAVALSPDGRLLAYDDYPNHAGSDGKVDRAPRVFIRDVETGATWRTVDGLHSHIRKLAFAPDGRQLAISCDDRGVVVYDCQTDRWLHGQPLTGSSGDNCHDLAFTPDGQRLAAVTRVQVLIWDV